MPSIDSLPIRTVRPARRRRYADAPGFNLRAIRRELGCTLDELRAATGLANATISHFERGHSRPTREVIRRLGRALGVPVAVLVNDRAFRQWREAQRTPAGEP